MEEFTFEIEKIDIVFRPKRFLTCIDFKCPRCRKEILQGPYMKRRVGKHWKLHTEKNNGSTF
jgi:hypothetical protein